MAKNTVRGIAALAVAVLWIGAASECARASSVVLTGPSALVAKVYRVFGDDDQTGDGANAAKRAARKRCRRCAMKRTRVERHTTPEPNDAEQHPGVLELLQPANG